MPNKKKLVFFLIILIVITLSVIVAISKTRHPKPQEVIMQEDKSALGLKSAPDGSLIYFDKDAKTFFRISKGLKEELYKSTFEPYSLSYSKDRSKVMMIGESGNPYRPIVIVDFASNKSYVLDGKIVNASFSPDGKKISYQISNDLKRT